MRINYFLLLLGLVEAIVGEPELIVDRGCFKVCGYNYSPVCASSGKTYPNKCSFEVDNCLSGYQWTMTKEEHCKACPSEAPIATCLVNPCDESTCPAHPLAECSPSHCGKCEAEFFVGAQKVECIPQATKKELSNIPRAKDVFPEPNFDGCSAECDRAYRPVCGSDRRTHLSECHMRKAACTTNSLIFKMHNGECGQCKLVCTRELKPHCGSDGVTYANKCLMELKTCETSGRLSLAYVGTCEEPECPSLCTAHYRPVCGTDGKTYGNWCELQVASCKTKGAVKFSYEGECRQCLPVCTAEYDPFCGTDGKTYGNRCMMNYGVCTTGGRVQVKYQGECGKPRCLENCTRIVDPVCGTDNRTYRNLCLLSQVTCSSKGKTFLAYVGLCASRCQSYKACPSLVKPVCGTDGETYVNSCLLRGATCRSGGTISHAYAGFCKISKCPADQARVVCAKDPCNTAVCPQHPRASCRTNACGSCSAEFFYGDEKVKCGSECSQVCTKEYFPFCGTDGKTYSNKCVLNVARCLHGPLQLAYQGPCKSALRSFM